MLAIHHVALGILRELLILGSIRGLCTVNQAGLSRVHRQEVFDGFRASASAVKEVHDLAKLYDRNITLDEAQRLLEDTNAQLNSFYDKYPGDRAVALKSNPQLAMLDAQAKSLRDGIYRTLDAPGEGGVPRDLQRRWGALAEVKEEMIKRHGQTRRQKDNNLVQQMTHVNMAGDIIRGTGKALVGMKSGNPGAIGSGIFDVATAFGKREIANMAKEAQSTDALLRKAFEGFTDRHAPTIFPVNTAAPQSEVINYDALSAANGVPVDQSQWGHLRQFMPGARTPISAVEVPRIPTWNRQSGIAGTAPGTVNPGSAGMYRESIPFLEPGAWERQHGVSGSAPGAFNPGSNPAQYQVPVIPEPVAPLTPWERMSARPAEAIPSANIQDVPSAIPSKYDYGKSYKAKPYTPKPDTSGNAIPPMTPEENLVQFMLGKARSKKNQYTGSVPAPPKKR